MKKFFKVIKSSENNLIMSLKEGKNLDILKIAQRGNASLQKEYETLLKLKNISKIYNFFLPTIYSNRKIKSALLKNKFHFLQKYQPGLTLSKLIQKSRIKSNKAKNISEILVDSLVTIMKEDFKSCVNEKPSELFLFVFFNFNLVFSFHIPKLRVTTFLS